MLLKCELLDEGLWGRIEVLIKSFVAEGVEFFGVIRGHLGRNQSIVKNRHLITEPLVEAFCELEMDLMAVAAQFP